MSLIIRLCHNAASDLLRRSLDAVFFCPKIYVIIMIMTKTLTLKEDLAICIIKFCFHNDIYAILKTPVNSNDNLEITVYCEQDSKTLQNHFPISNPIIYENFYRFILI